MNAREFLTNCSGCQTQTNRLACLRLVERSADILLNVREEIHGSGNVISDAMKTPMDKLVAYVNDR